MSAYLQAITATLNVDALGNDTNAAERDCYQIEAAETCSTNAPVCVRCGMSEYFIDDVSIEVSTAPDYACLPHAVIARALAYRRECIAAAETSEAGP